MKNIVTAKIKNKFTHDVISTVWLLHHDILFQKMLKSGVTIWYYPITRIEFKLK